MLAAWVRADWLRLLGGLFGLMAGLFVPSWRDRRAVPQLARGTVSYLVGFLLLMNGCGSFKAGVGGMAHLGGGLVGAVLAGSGLLMVGMRSQGRTTRPGWRWIYRLAALGALGLTGTVVALAFAAGRPWELRQPALEQAWLPRKWRRPARPGRTGGAPRA